MSYCFGCCLCMLCLARPLVYSSFCCLCRILSLLGMPLLIGLEHILLFGLLVGFNVLIVLGPLLLKRFGIFGMFTFGKLDLFPLQFVSIFSGFATHLMSIRPGFFGVVRLRLVLLVLIFLQVALPSRVPAVMLVVAPCPFIPCG